LKFQWNLILALIFALIVAIFAVINVDPVSVNFLFGQSEWPLILVILGSVLMGGLIVGSVGLVRIYILQRKMKALQRQNEQLSAKINDDVQVEKIPEHDITNAQSSDSSLTEEESRKNEQQQ
jgi:putative membrane protein